MDVPALAARAAPLLDCPDFGFEAWFYGSETQDVPRWTGYTLGFTLVGHFLREAGGDAATHVHTPADAFRAAWAAVASA